jgi:hypothetical protein
MKKYHVEVSRVIAAPAEAIYAVLADYEEGHLAILPKPYFTDMIIEKGGQGAGTVALVRMNVMGAKRSFRLETSEPEPGRILEEVDEENGVSTRFTVDPLADDGCRVTIATDARTQPGIRGLMERLLNPSITRRIYKKELENLANYVRK